MDRERIVQLFFFGFLAVMAYELYELMLPFLTPLAWGILLAFMAHPALIEVEKYVKRRSLSTAIISVVVSLVVILPAVWASGRLVVEAQTLYTQASASVNNGGMTKLQDWAVNTDLGAWVAKRMGERGYKLSEQLPKITLQAAQITSDYVAKNATQVAKNIFGFIVDFGIALLAFFYMLRDGDFYYRSLQDLTPLHDDDKAAIFDTLRTTLSSVMRGLMLTAVLQGVTIGLGMLIFGVPYWLFLAIASAAAGLMPIGGTALVWIPATIYLGFASSWSAAVGLVIWSSIALAVIDNFIKPLAMKHGTGLPTIALFLGILGGLEAYGPLGLFLGPAIMSVFAALLRVYRKEYSGSRKEAA
ncbi:MAG: AI-2E family transporter [Candidatus Binatus sp.]|uniref:AI-2E family transporter n=1 Tax=Candidatus Binatus sp. TaxID=2811406 RepID=UPI003C762408